MRQTADNILNQRGYEYRQRWVTDDSFEYLYLVLGTASTGGQDLVWAIVRVGRESIEVNIQHLDLSLLPKSSHQMVIDCANDLHAALKARKCGSTIASVNNPPDHAALGVSPE